MSYDPELFADHIETYLIHGADGPPLPYVPQSWFESSPYAESLRVRNAGAKSAYELLAYSQRAAVGASEWPASIVTNHHEGMVVYAARPVRKASKAWRKHGEGRHCVVEVSLAAPNADIRADDETWRKATGMQQANGYAWRCGDSWESTAETTSHFRGAEGIALFGMIGVLASASVISASSWRARFSLGGAAIDVPTTLEGARALFADRHSGGSRRAALRHWVRAHSRHAGNVTRDVVAHLRGASKFEWRGMTAELLASADDDRGGLDTGAAMLAKRFAHGVG